MGDEAAPVAVARIHHCWITALVLSLITRRGEATAEEFVFRLFRRQHLERFLSGLDKLGLAQQPHAVAAAKYHYFSNQLGGVRVEFLAESERKAWIRYPPPRWIWDGAALCAIPPAVNLAMLRGWHAHNGVSLGNPRLGFVCTGTTVDGDPGLEGYYLEHDRDLEAHERLRFAPAERCPYIDPATLPVLDAHAWPAVRQAKAYRNYAMEYIRNALPIVVSLLGPVDALSVGRRCSMQVGMQCYAETAHALGIGSGDADSFMGLMSTLFEASGDSVARHGGQLLRGHWRLFPDGSAEPVVSEIWLALYQGLLAAHNRFLRLHYDGVRRFWLQPA